jgi:peptide/nickel transport system permease protein
MAVSVLSVATPPGVLLGLIAGYMRDSWVDTAIMRVADVFLSVPSMVLALAVCSMLEPTLYNAMLAVTIMWWPWYTRLVYGTASSIKNEYFVQAAEVTGASTLHILFSEIFPNCLSTIFTKMTLDVGWVILIGSTLSFVGLGAQPPTPDLGTMVSDGSKYIPAQWWISLFPALFIVVIILGFNLLGDGVRDMLAGD